MSFLPPSLSKWVVKISLTTLSVILAVSTPAAAITAQQTSLQSALDLLKQKITTAIDNNIAKLQQSSDSLSFSLNVSIDKNGLVASTAGPAGGSASGSISSTGATGEVTTPKGGTASGSVSSSGATGEVKTANGGNAQISAGNGSISGSLSVPQALKNKLQESNQKAIDMLKALKAKVDATNSLADLQAKAKEFDQEFKDIATANVQASVTKSIDSMTKVLDHLQLAANNLQTQVAKLKECIQTGSIDVNASVNASGSSGSVNASAPGCTTLNVDLNSGDAGASLQAKLDEIKSSMQTIRSFLTSSIGLVTQLKDGNYNGTMQSFKGISAQVDIVVNLSSDVKNNLANLSIAVNK